MISKKQSQFFWGLLLGSVVGGAIPLLLTPESGAKIRECLTHGMLNGKRSKRANASSHKVALPRKTKKKVPTKRTAKKESE